jgi:hypothetical protein
VSVPESRVYVADRQDPAADRQVPAADRQVPAADRQVPAADRRVPAADRQVSAADKRVPTLKILSHKPLKFRRLQENCNFGERLTLFLTNTWKGPRGPEPTTTGKTMTDKDTRRYDMFVRAKTFGDDNATDFVVGSAALGLFIELDGVIGKLESARAGQNTSARTSKQTILDAIRLDLQNITRTAAAIAQREPGFADNFRPPTNSNEGALMVATDKILQQLATQPGDSIAITTAKAALVAKFVAHEMNPGFVTMLQSDRAAVIVAKAQLETGREDSVASNAAIGQLIAEGMEIVTTLDAIMHNKYGSAPDRLAAWVSASHIERDPHHAKPAAAPTPEAVK